MTMGSPVALLWLISASVLLRPAAASCPDVNTAVNCSFEASDSCLKSYQRYDKHGLKWSTNDGAIYRQTLDMSRVSPYGYQYYDTVTVLDASPNSQYLYVPATTDPRAVGIWTDLVSPPLTASGPGCLYFQFHNNVCDELSDPRDAHFKVLFNQYSDVKGMKLTGSTLVREFPCIGDEKWYSAKIPIVGMSGIYRVVFSAKQHGIYDKTIAVDHVIYTDQSCSIREDFNFELGDCDFEDSDLCEYRHVAADTGPLDWTPVQKEMLVTHLNTTVQAPDGYFLCVWGRDEGITADTASVTIHSPEVSIRNEGCLTLQYYSGRYQQDNNDMKALRVTFNDSTSGKTVLHEFPATLGDEPIRAFVPLPRGRSVLTFSALVQPPFGDIPDDVICLDDIEVHQKSCDEIRCEDPQCEQAATGDPLCSGHGTCLGQGIKHKSCQCAVPYIGKDCDYNPESTSIPRNRWDRYPYY